MKNYNTFYIHTAEFNQVDGIILFHYSFDKSEYFTETISLSENFTLREDIKDEVIENILFHCSIAFGISYYKLFPTKEIIVDSGQLDADQEAFWRNFYVQGLGEFFYTHNMDFRELCRFRGEGKNTFKKQDFSLSEKTLLPIGGGKDSIVSAILLEEKNEQNITPFIFGKSDRIKDNFLEVYQKPELLIKRSIDPKLFSMNKQGYYNGHVPITGLISFFMTFVCYIYDYKNIIFSNEKSANVGNTNFHENEINHQYSKSQQFENDFSNYVRNYISENIHYSSLLREYYELKIAKTFAEKGKKYFNIFSSCNANFSITKTTTKKWCNSCPKCLFVYIILRPFITQTETFEIFGEELYERKDLENLFLELIGETGIKPFECVGEIEEARLAAYMAIDNFGSSLPYLLETFQKTPCYQEVILSEELLRKKYGV